MNNLLYSKQGTINKSLLMRGISILVFAILIFPDQSWMEEIYNPYYTPEYIGAFFTIFLIFGFVAGPAIISIAISCGKMYINIYQDRIEGSGLSGLRRQSFYLNRGQFNVSVNRKTLNINSNTAKYRLFFSEAESLEIYRILNDTSFMEHK